MEFGQIKADKSTSNKMYYSWSYNLSDMRIFMNYLSKVSKYLINQLEIIFITKKKMRYF